MDIDALLTELRGQPDQANTFFEAYMRLQSGGVDAGASRDPGLTGSPDHSQSSGDPVTNECRKITPSDVSQCFTQHFGDSPPASVQQARGVLIAHFGRNFSRVFVSASLARHYEVRAVRGVIEKNRGIAIAILAELRAQKDRAVTAQSLGQALVAHLGYEPSPSAIHYCLKLLTQRAFIKPGAAGDGGFSLADDSQALDSQRAGTRSEPSPKWGTCADAISAIMQVIRDLDLYEQLFHAIDKPYATRPKMRVLRSLLAQQVCVSDSLISEVVAAFYGIRERAKQPGRVQQPARLPPELRHHATSRLDKTLVDAVTNLSHPGLTEIVHYMQKYYGPVSGNTLRKQLRGLNEIEKTGTVYHLAGRQPVVAASTRPDSKGQELLAALKRHQDDFPRGMMSSKMIQFIADQEGIKLNGSSWLSSRKNFFRPVQKQEALDMLHSDDYRDSVFSGVLHAEEPAMYRLATTPSGEKPQTLKEVYQALLAWIQTLPPGRVFRQKAAQQGVGTTLDIHGLVCRLVDAGVIEACVGGYRRSLLPGAGEQVSRPARDGGIWPGLPQHLRTPYVAAVLQALDRETRVPQRLTMAQRRSAQQAGDIFASFDATPQTGVSQGTIRSADDRPIERAHLHVLPNPGGGDCLLHALEGHLLSEGQAARLRQSLAGQRARLPDTDASRTLNAENLALSLAMIDTALARSATQGLTALSNASYAKILSLPGHYLGNDEIQHYCQLRDEARQGLVPLSVAVLDAAGDLMLITSSSRTVVAAASCSRDERLHRAMRADIVLFNDGRHYEKVTGPRQR